MNDKIEEIVRKHVRSFGLRGDRWEFREKDVTKMVSEISQLQEETIQMLEGQIKELEDALEYEQSLVSC